MTATAAGSDCEKDSSIIECLGDNDGISVGISLPEQDALADVWPPGSSPEDPSSWYVYVAVVECPGNTPGNPREAECVSAYQQCEPMDEAPGPFARIVRREEDENGPVSGTNWVVVGHTCFTPFVPARSGDDAGLTQAMLVEAFHRTDFAVPALVHEPAGGTALVNMPMYFEVVFPETGFEPDEVDTVSLAGFEVRIRPRLEAIAYNTGDGTVIGPTESLGGSWPDGDVTHTYTSAADKVSPEVSITYGGEVSIDGGDWFRIPATAELSGSAEPFQVATSKNRLYTNPGG